MTDRLGAGPPAVAGQRTAAPASVRPGRRVIADQAAAFTLRSPFAILDAATAVLGIVLAVTVLATAGRSGAAVPPAEGPAASVTHAAHRSRAPR